jgi:hypothetical protein
MNIPKELLCKDLVFHFTTANTAIECILRNGSMRFSPMDEMNDPYEYKISSSGILCWSSITDGVNREITRRLKKTVLKDSKLACFVGSKKESENPFKHCFSKPRSWAQYGDSQRGICLGFNRDALLKNIYDGIQEISLHKGFVEYDLDSRKASTKGIISFDNNTSVEENIYRHISGNQTDMYFRKYSDFIDEEEYRIVIVDKSEAKNQYVFCPIEGALEYIVLGDRFNKVYRKLIKEFGERYSAKVYQLTYGRVPYMHDLSNT